MANSKKYDWQENKDKDSKYRQSIVAADKKLVGRAYTDAYYKPRNGNYKSTTGRKTRWYTGGGF